MFFGQAQDGMVRLQGIKYNGSGNCNPADVILDIISGVDACSLQSGLGNASSDEKSRNSITCLQGHRTRDDWNSNLPLRSGKEQIASWHRQVYLTFLRGTRQQGRRYTSFVLEILSGAVIGLPGYPTTSFMATYFRPRISRPSRRSRARHLTDSSQSRVYFALSQSV